MFKIKRKTNNFSDTVTALFTVALTASLLLGSAITSLASPPPPATNTTAPYTVSYSGRLTDAAGVPVTTAQDLRFSLWTGNNFNPATDILPSGAINPAGVGFTGWEEIHTVTPDANGLFHVRLGSINVLPNFTSSVHVYLQVEVEANGLPLTSFECLDPDGILTDGNDRYPLDSSAFTINADTVDNYDVGSGANQLPPTDGGGLLPISTIPGATNADTFIIDDNDTIPPGGPGSVTLQFGNTLGKILEYDTVATWFNFNDDVNISGDLTTIGTINGVTINNTTVGPYDQSLDYSPVYADSVIQQDGTNNKGKLENFYLDDDGIPGNNNYNYYKWTTQQGSLQDIDIVLRVTIPEGFKSWQVTPVTFKYKTQDGLVANNKIDMTIEDTAGNPVTLTGAGGLVSASFTTANITFGGAPVWTVGQPITIKIKLTASNIGAAYAGRLSLNYNGR